jgi:hypothetical protein
MVVQWCARTSSSELTVAMVAWFSAREEREGGSEVAWGARNGQLVVLLKTLARTRGLPSAYGRQVARGC